MKFYFFFRGTIDNDGYWTIPVLGSGYLHNISVRLWVYGQLVDDYMRMTIGNQSYYRQELSLVADVPNFFKGSDARNWHINVLPAQLSGTNLTNVLYAHRKSPLYVKYGEDLYLNIDAGGSVSNIFFMIEAEFIPYWESVCKMHMTLTISEPGASGENFGNPVMLPFSAREGIVEYQAIGSGSTTNDENGYLYPRYLRKGTDTGKTKQRDGWGTIDANILGGAEVMASGGSVKKPIVVGNNLSGVSKTKAVEKIERLLEGWMLEFDFTEIVYTLDAIFLSIDFMFKVMSNRRHYHGCFVEGDDITSLNELNVYSL